MENIILIVVGVVALVIGLYLLKYLFIGAIALLEWAGESGFVGVAAYFACWVFLFPLMLAGCIITGALASWSE
ncbi:MAG: hypothetical protein H8D23_19915 [Candidatus Brocadiales bacterium]|nr:hypothetical protein [Candidatus Brocadiales bacterium]